MTVQSLTPQEARKLVAQGATLVDVREADEHARAHVPGSLNVPLASLGNQPLPDGPIIFHCRTGMRTQANAAQLAQAAGSADCYLLAGGLDAWTKEGLPARVDRKQPLEIMRQVQITAGGLVLIGVLLGWLVAPAWFALSAFVGAGLMFAGISGWCGMANLLRIMPWNRQAAG